MIDENEQKLTDEAMAAEGEPAAAPAGELEVAQAELAETKDRLLRLAAEMENLRRRTQRDLDEGRKYATTSFARGLLDVADNLSRALGSVPADEREGNEFIRGLVTGIEMTERSLLALFEKHEIQKVVPAKGEKFDHNRHQAMFEVQTADLPSGTIAEVLQPGYVIADRLLRPAMVGVAKGGAKAAEPAGGASLSGAAVDQKV